MKTEGHGVNFLCAAKNLEHLRKFAQTDYWQKESSRMSKHLQLIRRPVRRSPEGEGGRGSPKPTSARSKRSHQGWCAARRARQAALIRRLAPWCRSTGPKTDAGRARCSMNALKHGLTSRAYRHERRRKRELMRRARQVLRLATCNLLAIRGPACGPVKYKPAFRPALQRRRMPPTHLTPIVWEVPRWPRASR